LVLLLWEHLRGARSKKMNEPLELDPDDPAYLISLLDALAAKADKIPDPKWRSVAVLLWQASSDIADAFVGPEDVDTEEPDIQEAG
jgi:hypothetical protein